jgi:hypothetical protein
MGHRANLIDFQGGQYDLYYSHWAANTLPRDLFWGPAHAVLFVRAQRPVESDSWLDDVWAEGGAIIDSDARVFRLFGGEDLAYDVPLRRLYLQLLSAVWEGWYVGWAHEGIADLADYVGLPRERVLTRQADEPGPVDLYPPVERDWVDLVGSFRLPDRTIKLFPLAGQAPDYLLTGPILTEAALSRIGLDRLHVADWTTTFPTGGFHLDVPARVVRFWDARDRPGIEGQVRSKWPGWAVTWDRDGYEAQLSAVSGVLSFPDRTVDTLLAELTGMLLRQPSQSPAESVLWFAEHERAAGKSVEVNPLALRDDRVELSQQEKGDILARAVASLGLRPGYNPG